MAEISMKIKLKKIGSLLLFLLLLFLLFFVLRIFQKRSQTANFHGPEGIPIQKSSPSSEGVDRSQALKLSLLENAYKAAVDAQNVDVKFYGKVVDQDLNPVIGAKIEFDLLNGAASISSGDAGDAYRLSVVSGIDGLFSIEGQRARALTIAGISKDGYRPVSPTGKTYGYSDTPEVYTPSKAAPEVFVISNKEINEFRGELTFPISWNKGFVSYFMTGGKTVGSSSDVDKIMISAKRSAPPAEGGHFDWSVILKVEGAVCQLARNGETSVPVDGYRDEVVVGYTSNQSPWMSSSDFTLFYKKASGGGAAVITIYSDFNRMSRTFHANCYTFPSGTRVFGEVRH